MTSAILQLIKSFMLVGIGAYGGGLVTIPLIQHEIVVVQGWMAFKEMASLLAIAQMTPGPIAINAATFVGFRIGSFTGAAAATFAVVFPSLCIIAAIAPFVDRVSKNPHVIKLRDGLQIGVVSLIIFATWSYGSIAVTSLTDLILAVATFIFLVVSEGKYHPAIAIIVCGILGLILF